MRVLSQPAAVEFPEEWYDLAHEDHFWMQWRLRAFIRQLGDLGIPRHEPLRGFEIGCGNGVFRRQVEQSTAWCVDGAEINEESFRHLVATRGEDLLYDIHDRHRELEAAYDAVLLFDVIEHVDDTLAFLDAALYHLRPGGWLFVNVPAHQAFWSAYDEAQGHFRRYKKSTLRAELEPHGLQVRNIRYWGLSLVPLAFARAWVMHRKPPTPDSIREGFHPPNEFAHLVLRGVMRLETRLLARPVVGTSLLAAATKAG
jgi:SAM-dependent methyltransferase